MDNNMLSSMKLTKNNRPLNIIGTREPLEPTPIASKRAYPSSNERRVSEFLANTCKLRLSQRNVPVINVRECSGQEIKRVDIHRQAAYG